MLCIASHELVLEAPVSRRWCVRHFPIFRTLVPADDSGTRITLLQITSSSQCFRRYLHHWVIQLDVHAVQVSEYQCNFPMMDASETCHSFTASDRRGVFRVWIPHVVRGHLQNKLTKLSRCNSYTIGWLNIRHASPRQKRWIFRKLPGGGGHFRAKKLCCKF